MLKGTKIRDDDEELIIRIINLPGITENFLTSLIREGFHKCIQHIYGSPLVLSGIKSLGLETDPRAQDSTGKSAFFHALRKEDPELVFLLHDYAASSHVHTSSQSSTQMMIHNLSSLNDDFNLLCKNQEFEQLSEKSKYLFQDLCKFNQFQLEMCKNIDNIKFSINPDDHPEKEYNILQRVETILIIIKTYCKFDYINGESCRKASDINRFKEFTEHKYYFDKLDTCFALILLENLFVLKELLLLPKNTCFIVESALFPCIFWKNYLKDYETKKYSLFSQWVVFKERLLLQTQLRSLKEMLELSKSNLIDNLSEIIFQDLTNLQTIKKFFSIRFATENFIVFMTDPLFLFTSVPLTLNLPEIYGESFLSRLLQSLDAATGVSIRNLKSTLVIERCLQIMGECLRESDFTSVDGALLLGLPRDLVKNLLQISDYLDSKQPQKLLCRNILENDLKLREEIQTELEQVTKLVGSMCAVQTFKKNQILFFHYIVSVREAKRDFFKDNENFQNTWNRYFDCMYDYLRKKIIDQFTNRHILDEENAHKFKKILRNLIVGIGEELENLKADYTEKDVKELSTYFWSLEIILTYITTDRSLSEHRKNLIMMFARRKKLFLELKKLLLRKETFDIGRTSVEKSEISFKKLSLETRDICDSSQEIVNIPHTFEKYGDLINIKPSNTVCLNERPCSEINEVETMITSGNYDKNIFKSMIDEINLTLKEFTEDSDLQGNDDIPKKKAGFEVSEKVHSFPADIYRFLLSDVVDDVAYLVESQAKICREFTDVKEDMKIFLADYEKFANNLFLKYPDKEKYNFHFDNIEKYCMKLKGCFGLENEEKESILQNVPKELQNVPDVKQRVKFLLKEATEFTEELKVELSKLKLEKKALKTIKWNIEQRLNVEAIRIVHSAYDYYSDLKEVVDLKEIDKTKYKLLCEKLELPDCSKKILSKIVPEERNFEGNEFEFLRNRLQILKKILIDENDSIKQVWYGNTDFHKRMELVKKEILQLYLNDPKIQASVEMIIFDCSSILCSKEMQKLWKKMTNLFSEIQLRKMSNLIHPFNTPLGSFINPCDLQSELVEKILQLISDEPIVDCMQQILKQSRTNFSGFMQIIYDEENQRFKNLRDLILECDHWQKYALLIPSHKAEE